MVDFKSPAKHEGSQELEFQLRSDISALEEVYKLARTELPEKELSKLIQTWSDFLGFTDELAALKIELQKTIAAWEESELSEWDAANNQAAQSIQDCIEDLKIVLNSFKTT